MAKPSNSFKNDCVFKYKLLSIILIEYDYSNQAKDVLSRCSMRRLRPPVYKNLYLH